jgi:phosphoglucosamine mutase
VKQAHAHAQTMLNGTGRILIRLSGTEPVARIMVEGRDPHTIEAAAETLAHVIERAIGTTTVVPSEF